jgi:hypothetical protein
MQKRRFRAAACGWLLAVAVLSFSISVSAQDTPFVFQGGAFANMMMQPNVDRMLKNNMRLARGGGNFENSLRAKPAVAASASTVASLNTSIAAVGSPSMPAKMAAYYPEGSRSQVEKTFRELLDKYGQVERQFDIPRHDTAGAVAAFIAGSYMAYRNSDFPDAHFKLLVNQMRGIIAGNAEFAQATGAEKQEMYEQMAIAGMLMAGTQMALKQQPNQQAAANMKQAAKGYLEQFLKTDADRVQITANGLVLK